MPAPGIQHIAVFTILSCLAGAGSAGAAEPGPRNWPCSRCADLSGWEFDITAGPAYGDPDAYRFGDYTGIDDSGVYPFSDFSGSYRGSDANYLLFEGYTRSADASALFIKGGVQSKYELRASYQTLPRRLYATTLSPYNGSGGTSLTLPADWVRGNTTGQMTRLDETLRPVTIGRDWTMVGLGFDIESGRRWEFSTDYTRREQRGTARSSGAFLFSATEFVAPVDYSTDDLEIALRYSAETWQTSLTYFGSIFRNDNASLSFANPYLGINGADAGQLALPPGNESHQLRAAGSAVLPARTTVSGQLSLGHLTQNADLLPFTTNAALNAGPTPIASASASADTLNVNLRAVTRPFTDWSFTGEFRYNDFDNRTDINLYAYSVTDVRQASAPAASSAYDYVRRDFEVSAEYAVLRRTRLLGGFDTRRVERNDQDRSRTTTNRLWFRVRTRLADMSQVDMDLFTEERGGSDYNPAQALGAPQNPLLRKYNMADRDRRGLRVRGTLTPGERSDLGWELEFGRDDYGDGIIGLARSDYLRFGGDFSYLLTDRATAYAGFYNESIESRQNNSQSFATADWSATTDDRFTTVTAGVTWPELFGPVGARVDLIWSDSKGEIRTDTSGLPGQFPALRTTQQSLRLGLDYPYSQALGFGVDYRYEKYASDDWALDGVGPATVPNLLALGAEAWNYSGSVVYLNFSYRLRVAD